MSPVTPIVPNEHASTPPLPPLPTVPTVPTVTAVGTSTISTYNLLNIQDTIQLYVKLDTHRDKEWRKGSVIRVIDPIILSDANNIYKCHVLIAFITETMLM